MYKLVFLAALLISGVVNGQVKKTAPVPGKAIVTGAERLEAYLPVLKNKSVAVFANQTSMVGETHLVDVLIKNGIDVRRIFSPEHGFRGNADAGEHVETTVDSATKLPIVSLYGKHNKPTAEELKDIDVLLFDIQDVGVRFYTYINSMQYFMEAAIENDKPLLLLDRPNPNGFYVDGPILQPAFASGVGVQPVPIVYGMTMGEYAKMLLGEKMLNEKTRIVLAGREKLTSTKKPVQKAVPPPPSSMANFKLSVITCSNYDHTMVYNLPVKPSPNLPNLQSVLLYPSTCFFEGTELSLGRGTDKPFQVFGHPSLPDTLFSFTPVSLPGAKTPPLLGNTCYGYDLSSEPTNLVKNRSRQINLSYLLKAYKMFPQKDSFFLRPKKGNPSTTDYFLINWQVMIN